MGDQPFYLKYRLRLHYLCLLLYKEHGLMGFLSIPCILLLKPLLQS